MSNIRESITERLLGSLGSIILTILMAIGCVVFYYFALPPVNLRSGVFWVFLFIVAACIAASVTLLIGDESDTITAIAIILPIAIVVIGIICEISSLMVFHADKAYQVADVTISEKPITEDFEDLTNPASLKNLPLVDLDTARMLGDKKVAKLQNASWYDVDDEYNLIKTKQGYYRLSVIDYGGFFKYNKAKNTGLPGYVLVNVTPDKGVVTQDAEIVELEDKILYSPGAFWSHDLSRHLRFQFPSYIFDSSYLEIDDNGNPYWVTGILRPTAGPFGVATVTSFILTNAQTGASEEYDVANAPEWIDHIFSLDYLMKIAYWHYAYADGYWNNVFSKTGVLRTSYEFRDKRSAEDAETVAGKFANFFGYSSIVDRNGEVHFYTGLTAANNADSNVGWLTIDTSTGKMTQYDVVGAEESSAQAAVEQLVQAQGYQATFPLPTNIAGTPSYIMCLKGKAGFAQAYGICNVENYSIAAVGETLDQTIKVYQLKLGSDEVLDTALPDSTTLPANVELDTTSQTVVIDAIYTAEIDGTTQFYYLIDGTLYRAPITINELQIIFKKGDEVIINSYPTDDVEIITSIKKSS